MHNRAPSAPPHSYTPISPPNAVDRDDFAVHKHRRSASTGGGRAWTEEEVRPACRRLASSDSSTDILFRKHISSAPVKTRCPTSTSLRTLTRPSLHAVYTTTRCHLAVRAAADERHPSPPRAAPWPGLRSLPIVKWRTPIPTSPSPPSRRSSRLQGALRPTIKPIYPCKYLRNINNA